MSSRLILQTLRVPKRWPRNPVRPTRDKTIVQVFDLSTRATKRTRMTQMRTWKQAWSSPSSILRAANLIAGSEKLDNLLRTPWKDRW
jgi:hypothetical protein